MDDWKIEKRKSGCNVCGRAFESEERHISAITQVEGGHFGRRDQCMECWAKKTEEPFSFWSTAAPVREQRRLEDIVAMLEFFKKLIAQPTEDDTRHKIMYLTALLLMRKKRVKAAGNRTHDGRNWLVLEKSWDGEKIEIVDPPIADPELESLKLEMERLFNVELSGDPVVQADPATA